MSESIGQAIAAAIARAAHLPQDLVEKEVAANPYGFLPRIPGWKGRIARRILLPLTRYAEPAAVALTTAAKKVRSAKAGPVPFAGNLPLLQAAAEDPTARRRARCVLTHDVDWRLCYESLPWLTDLQERLGLRATYHFLTEWRYRPDQARLEAMAAAGHEIGLHGRLHDAAIGYRDHKVMEREIDRALKQLPTGVSSYRAPALGFSLPLAAVLASRGVKIDSSLLVVNRYGTCAQSVWPYAIAPGLTELPLTLQDDLLFRDLQLSDDEALALVRRQMEAVLNAGGTFVFNGHPGIMQAHRRFTEGVLNLVRDSGAPVTTMADPALLATPTASE